MKLSLELNLDNAAYKHDDGSLDMGQVAVSVWNVQDLISEGDSSGIIRDENGNKVGSWEITPAPDA